MKYERSLREFGPAHCAVANSPPPRLGIGERLLADIHWQSDPTSMLKLPSVAKGTALRVKCDAEAAKTGRKVEEIVESVQFVARIEHMASIGGEALRPLLLNESRLTPDQIARLCRRMPPFIAEKLKELRIGPVNIDSNPNGAFDTNGWGELRTRLPKFRSTLQQYAANCVTGHGGLTSDQFELCRRIVTEICSECDALSTVLKNCTPAGDGRPRAKRTLSVRKVNWIQAKTKFAQVLGVLQKTNRDLRSDHWKPEWIPTVADHQAITSDVDAMNEAAERILTSTTGAMNVP